MLHKHKCSDDTCGRVWQHDDKRLETEEIYEEAHRCPDCGETQRQRFFVDEFEAESFSVNKRLEEYLELKDIAKRMKNGERVTVQESMRLFFATL